MRLLRVQALVQDDHPETCGYVIADRCGGIATSTLGSGYWLAGTDGGVFAFGTNFAGSLVSIDLVPFAPVTGITTWAPALTLCPALAAHC